MRVDCWRRRRPTSRARAPCLGTFALHGAGIQVEGRDADAPDRHLRVWRRSSTSSSPAGGRSRGSTAADVTAAIVSMPAPSVSATQPLAPPALDHVVARCLEKESGRALAIGVRRGERTALDRRFSDVERSRSTSGQSDGNDAPPVAVGSRPLRSCGRRGGVCRCHGSPPRVAAGGGADYSKRPTPLPSNAQLAAARPSVAISPDGRFLAFVGAEGGVSKLVGTGRLTHSRACPSKAARRQADRSSLLMASGSDSLPMAG